MQPREVRQIVSDFFTPGKEVIIDLIPDIMQWKADYFKSIENNCGNCSSSKSKLEYSNKIKKILYGR